MAAAKEGASARHCALDLWGQGFGLTFGFGATRSLCRDVAACVMPRRGCMRNIDREKGLDLGPLPDFKNPGKALKGLTTASSRATMQIYGFGLRFGFGTTNLVSGTEMVSER